MKYKYIIGLSGLTIVFFLGGFFIVRQYEFSAIRSLLIGFEFKKIAHYFQVCPQYLGDNVKQVLLFLISFSALPLISFACIISSKNKGVKQYVSTLFLLLVGLIAGTIIRILILREEIAEYSPVNNQDNFGGYWLDHFRFEEWACGGMCIMAIILFIKNNWATSLINIASNSKEDDTITCA